MRLRPLRPLVVGAGILVLTNGPLFFVGERLLDGDRGWEEPFTRAVLLAVAVTATAAVVLDRYRLDGARLARPHVAAAAPVVFMSAWIVLSSLWSLSPDIARGRALIYVGLAAFAWVIADLEFGDFRRALAVASGLGVGASLVTVALSSSIGSDINDDWRGIYTNRNSLAPVAGLAILAGLSLWFGSRRGRVWAGMLVGIGVVAMLGSGSRTAWLALVVAAGASLLLVAARVGTDRYGPRVRTAAIGIALLGIAVTSVMVSQLWNESTFVQRRTIWGLVWDRIGERPLHGFGWFNVWVDPDFTAADPLLGRGSAHGSFLEVWLGLGLIGLVPFLVIIGLALYGSLEAAWRRPSVASWTWLALVLFLVIENLTESFVLWFSYNWVLLMAAALRCGAVRRSRVEHRTPVPSEPATV
ncbi:MAG: O-antigen ligase family protein [Acidimicrobiales bacterium]